MKSLLLILYCFLVLAACSSYKSLHKKAIVIDTHNDALSEVVIPGLSLEKNLIGKAQTDINRLKEGGVDGQFFSVFCCPKYVKGKAFNFANRQIDSLISIVSRNRDKMMMAYTPEQLERIQNKGKIAVMIGLEGGHMIDNRLDYLDFLYNRGVRYMGLTWNNSTDWATSAIDESSIDSLPQAGLTDFGKKVVARMNELGMLVDLSHVGEKTFYDVLKVAKKPVLLSHSSAAALCPHPRNLTDKQIKAVSKNGGVIHVNFYSEFLDPDFKAKKQIILDKHKADSLYFKANANNLYTFIAEKYPEDAQLLKADPKLLIDHIDHIVKVGGIDHVGLGSDYDGIIYPPSDLEDVSKFPLVTKMLLQRGYSKEDITKILGKNFLRVWKSNNPR